MIIDNKINKAKLRIASQLQIDKATLIYTLQSRCPEMDVVNPGLVYDFPGMALSFEMSGGVTSSSTGAFRIDIRNETLFQGAQWVNQPDLLAFHQVCLLSHLLARCQILNNVVQSVNVFWKVF